MITNIQDNPITIWDFLYTFKDKLSDEEICQLERMLEELERDAILRISNSIYKELSNLIDHINDVAMYSREKNMKNFILLTQKN